MTDDTKNEPRPSSEPERKGRRLPRWKKGLLGCAAVLMLGGLGLQAYSHLAPARPWRAPPGNRTTPGRERPRSPHPSGDLRPRGYVEPAEPDALGTWSPAMFRMGFGFLAGFCVAYALRTFLKLAVLAIGLALLVVIGMSAAGLVEVDFSAMEQWYDRAAGWVARQTAGFREFATGYLPSSGAAVLGLLAGFKRH